MAKTVDFTKKIVCSYVNVYNRGLCDMAWSSREEADRQCSTAYTRVGIIETLKFDDGTYKNKYIEV